MAAEGFNRVAYIVQTETNVTFGLFVSQNALAYSLPDYGFYMAPTLDLDIECQLGQSPIVTLFTHQCTSKCLP